MAAENSVKSFLKKFGRMFFKLGIFLVFVVLIKLVLGWVGNIHLPFEYSLVKQIVPNQAIAVRLPSADDLHFVITGENLSLIEDLCLTIYSSDGNMKLISHSFRIDANEIVMEPHIISASIHVSKSFSGNMTNTLPISLLGRSDKLFLNISYKQNKNVKLSLSIRGNINLFDYKIGFDPLTVNIREPETIPQSPKGKWNLEVFSVSFAELTERSGNISA